MLKLHRSVLIAAGIYNILFGAFAVLFPLAIFRWAGMAEPNYPELWQCIGMIVGVYGAGYLAASRDPLRHWPVVMVGFMGKLFGPIGMAQALYTGRLPLRFGAVCITNDLIWLAPFGLILWHAYQSHVNVKRAASPDVLKWAMRARTQQGVPLAEISQLWPTLLVFLRHAGCPFCRETLSDLATQRKEIEAQGVKVVLVHMTTEEELKPLLDRYGLSDIARVSDNKQSLYRAFGLGRFHLARVLGPWEFLRGIQAIFIERHGLGWIDQDVFQMPGVFLVFHGEVLRSYRHQSAADRPDYRVLSRPQETPEAA
ncbi:MAG: redoxin domain-containing protein [Bryobacterales bacterium]|nr:redoxin domain-containing protein [Bryobacterales bacterium]